jgi:hypothetical protein
VLQAVRLPAAAPAHALQTPIADSQTSKLRCSPQQTLKHDAHHMLRRRTLESASSIVQAKLLSSYLWPLRRPRDWHCWRRPTLAPGAQQPGSALAVWLVHQPWRARPPVPSAHQEREARWRDVKLQIVSKRMQHILARCGKMNNDGAGNLHLAIAHNL